MDKKLVKELERRKRIIEIIKRKPGIHFRALQRESDLAMGELEYHLGVLEKMEVISKVKSDHYTKYYPPAELDSRDKELMGVLRQDILRDILLHIISCGIVKHGDIAKEFSLLKSTASFYLGKMHKEELIVKEKRGRNVYYRVSNPDRILRLILLYKEGFGDEIAKRVEGLWGNI